MKISRGNEENSHLSYINLSINIAEYLMRKHGKYCTEEQKYDFVKLKAFYPKLNQGRGLHSLLSNIGVIYYKTNTESKREDVEIEKNNNQK